MSCKAFTFTKRVFLKFIPGTHQARDDNTPSMGCLSIDVFHRHSHQGVISEFTSPPYGMFSDARMKPENPWEKPTWAQGDPEIPCV